jgi:hypothetical protein
MVTGQTSRSYRTGNTQSVQSLGYGLGLQGIVVRFPETPKDVFSPSKNQDRLWDLPSFLFNMFRGFLTRRLSGRGEKVTTHLHSVVRSKVNGIILPLHHITSWSAWEQPEEVCFIWIQCPITRHNCFLVSHYDQFTAIQTSIIGPQQDTEAGSCSHSCYIL